MTVGEAAGVTIEEAKRYAGFDEHELNMVFHFDHVGLDGGKLGKYSDNRVPLVPFKKIMSDWQTELEGKAWNSLYLSNHDQPRSLSRFGDDSPEYRDASAKMLATCLHMMQGTPYVYQGEELGMTNIHFADISEVNDIDSINAYHEMTEAGLATEEDMMRYINKKGRDNARTPMQWDDSANAGFTTGTPWLKVNPNYTTVNAKAELADENSIFHYYQKIIALRKEKPIMVYGHYELLEPDHESLYVYTRSLENQKLLVICSFTKDPVSYEIPSEFEGAEVLIGNYGRSDVSGKIELKPYEAIVLELNK
jgi:oligo-1,6-glucosidase